MRLSAFVLLGCLGLPLPASQPKVAPLPVTTPLGGGIVVMRKVPYLEVRYGVDVARLRKLKGMPDQGRGGWALQQIAAGKVPSSVQVKALVDTAAAARRSILEGLLRQDWPAADFSPERPDVAEFLDYSGRVLNLGDEFEYRFDGNAVWVRYQAEPWRVFRSPQLTQAVLRFNTRVVPANEEAMKAFQEALEEALKDLRPLR